MNETHDNSGAESASLLLKTGVRVQDAALAVSYATGLAARAHYAPAQFRTLTSLAQGREIAPEELAVPPGQVFPYVSEGKIEPLAKQILLAGLNAANPDRFEIEDPFEMSDDATSKLVAEMRASFQQKATRLLSALGTAGQTKPGRS